MPGYVDTIQDVFKGRQLPFSSVSYSTVQSTATQQLKSETEKLKICDRKHIMALRELAHAY